MLLSCILLKECIAAVFSEEDIRYEFEAAEAAYFSEHLMTF
jgi:hypothetical protein